MGKILGIDFGTKYLGLAISDETKSIAEPLPTLRALRNRNQAEVVILAIKKYDLELLVIGYPSGLNEKPTRMKKEMDTYTQELSQKLGIGYKLWNETYTSYQAGPKKMSTKKIDNSHSEAARIILQEYLDFIKTGI